GIAANAEAGPARVPVDHAEERLVKRRANEREIAGVLEVLANRFEQPERCIGGIVFGGGAAIRETVGKHAAIERSRPGLEELLCKVEAAGDERETGKGNHGVAAPVREPVVAGNDRWVSAGTPDEKCVGGLGQGGAEAISGRSSSGFGFEDGSGFGGGSMRH